MSGGLVTTGEIAVLAKTLTRQLGRRVTVHHSRYQFKLHGKVKWSPWRYTILIQDVTLPFSDLTVNEAKGRLAMLSDLMFAKVIVAGEPPSEPSPSYENRLDGGNVAPGGDDSY